ncbi:MAG TPA: hypothetical protein VM118_04200, partial [Acidobacteriota bacterium]|nr:hypothetical protein [Acidobacteriota bacterium]
MRTKNQILALTLGVVLLVLGGCGVEKGAESNGDEPPVDDVTTLRLEPLPDERAEVLALVLSDEIEAPLALYERIHVDLDRVAESNLPPSNSETFWPRHDPSQSLLTLLFHPGGRRAVQNGESHTWDSLNAIYQPWFVWPVDGSESVTVHFPGRLNVGLLGGVYAQVPEVESTSMFSLFGGGNALAAKLGGPDTLLYMFFVEYARFPPSVEPPADTFWCYYTRDDGISYVGRYVLARDLTPDWWSDFCTWVPFLGGDRDDLCDAELSHDSVLIRREPPETFRKDPCETHDVSIVDRTLVVAVSYSGGCGDHALNVIMTPREFAGGPSRIASLYL